jgi:hypothetical protein
MLLQATPIDTVLQIAGASAEQATTTAEAAGPGTRPYATAPDLSLSSPQAPGNVVPIVSADRWDSYGLFKQVPDVLAPASGPTVEVTQVEPAPGPVLFANGYEGQVRGQRPASGCPAGDQSYWSAPVVSPRPGTPGDAQGDSGAPVQVAQAATGRECPSAVRWGGLALVALVALVVFTW